MNANHNVLEVLAKEGIVMTEADLNRAVRGKPSNLDSQTMLSTESTSQGSAVQKTGPECNGKRNGVFPSHVHPPLDSNGPSTVSELPTATNEELGKHPKPKLAKARYFFLRGVCLLGIHDSGWAYMSQRECGQMLNCGRCGATKTRTKHRHEWLYAGRDKCLQIRTCVRCDLTGGKRTHHESWGNEWSTGGNNRAHRCNRCKTIETWTESYDSYD